MILVFIALVFILAGILAPAIIWQNRKYINKMEELVLLYEMGPVGGYKDDGMKRRKFNEILREITYIKRKIIVADKKSIEIAQDIINAFRFE